MNSQEKITPDTTALKNNAKNQMSIEISLFLYFPSYAIQFVC